MTTQQNKKRIFNKIFSESRLPIPHGDIYLMKCMSNGKKYVGQAVSHRYSGSRGRYYEAGYEKRIEEHFREAEASPKGCYRLNVTIRKYGRENFKCKLLMKCPKNFMDYFEKMYINHYDTINNGLNLNPGGFGGSHTSDTLQRISDTNVKKSRSVRLAELKKDKDNISTVVIDDVYMGKSLFIRMRLYTHEMKQYKYCNSVTERQKYVDCFDRAYKFALKFVIADNIYLGGRCILNLGDSASNYEFNTDEVDELKKQNKTTVSAKDCLIDTRYERYKHLKIERMDIRLRKRKGVVKITVCIKDDKRSRLTECEFGGETITIMDAYYSAIAFADMFNVDYKIFPDVISLMNQVRS